MRITQNFRIHTLIIKLERIKRDTNFSSRGKMSRNYCAKCKKKIRFAVLKHTERSEGDMYSTCPNIDFPRDHMHGVNISNHT